MRRHLLLLIVLLTGIGCSSQAGLEAPAGWEVVNHSDGPVAAIISSATEKPCTLQVFICYTSLLSSHVCLRLDGPGDHALFWDPGGSFGEGKEGVVRNGDLLLDEHALSVDGVWHYREVGCDERLMVMFEWQLTPEQALARRNVLIHGRDEAFGDATFDSDSPGGFCSVYVSDFLKRFGQGRPALPRKWFWPGNLGKHLWTQQPDRVCVFERGQPQRVYTQSPASTGEHAMHVSGR